MHISRPSMQNTFQLPRFIFGPLKEDILVSHKVVLTTNQSVHCTLLENHKKSLIQHCERSELRLHFEWTKVH